ncbi:MAG TPA: protease modulator HflC [Rhizomicrobium sp.]|nr:protease modulator HflC [Rhizomicrobium sp.]
MNRLAIAVGTCVSFVFILLVALSFYTISPTEQAIVLQFGAPLSIETEPGLHTKIPFVQTVEYIDKRLLNVEAPPEEVIAQDKKRLVVDAFARWRIVDPIKFYRRVYDKDTANERLTTVLGSSVRGVLGEQSFSAVLSDKRDQIMRDIRDAMNQETKDFGIDVVDVRIRHADLPAQNSEAIFGRMQQERKREAFEFRAEGMEISQSIRARADREATVITAEATREADILRGEGDAQKTRILGDAYGRDPDFFAFYRSMQAYQDALPSSSTSIVLSPNSEFFRYFSGGLGAQAHTPAKTHKR